MAADWHSEYPFPNRFHTIDGQKYHYVDSGQGDSPLVCVHGNPTWSFYYRRLLQDLSAQQRVLAVDHIGCGLSDKPSQYNYSLHQHTKNLIQWMDDLDLRRVVMVVHDWGGAIGLGAAVARPERVDKLLVLNTAAFPPPYIPWRIAACRFPLLGSFAVRYLNAFAYPATWMALHRPHRLSAKAKAGLLAPYDSAVNRVAIDGFVRDIPLSRRHPTLETLRQLQTQLPSIANKPTRFVWGMRDWCFRPECLEIFLDVFKTASVNRLEDVGHYVMEEAAEVVLQEAKLLLEQPL